MGFEPEHFQEALLSLGKQGGLIVGFAQQELCPLRTRRLEHQLKNRLRLFGIVVLQIGKSQQKQNPVVAGSGRVQGLQIADRRRHLSDVGAANCEQLPGLQVLRIDRNHARKAAAAPANGPPA